MGYDLFFQGSTGTILQQRQHVMQIVRICYCATQSLLIPATCLGAIFDWIIKQFKDKYEMNLKESGTGFLILFSLNS
jgi:hypothetical protein